MPTPAGYFPAVLSHRENAQRVRGPSAIARGARPLVALALAAGALLIGSAEAKAQAQYFQLDRAQLSGAPDDGFMVWRPVGHPETRLYATGALGYSHNP